MIKEYPVNTKEKEMEDLQNVCNLLTTTLRATRNLNNLTRLEYDKKTEKVKAIFDDGRIRTANVAADSGTSMIRDIIAQII